MGNTKATDKDLEMFEKGWCRVDRVTLVFTEMFRGICGKTRDPAEDIFYNKMREDFKGSIRQSFDGKSLFQDIYR
jgi:hypothetical protein